MANAVYVEQDLCSNDSIDEMEWESAVDTVNQARDRFYVAARESLGGAWWFCGAIQLPSGPGTGSSTRTWRLRGIEGQIER